MPCPSMWPKQFWSVQIVIHFGRKSQFGPDQFILVVTISFWSRPNHYGQVQINLVIPKLFWLHRRTRHKYKFLACMLLFYTIQIKFSSFFEFWNSVQRYRAHDDNEILRWKFRLVSIVQHSVNLCWSHFPDHLWECFWYDLVP